MSAELPQSLWRDYLFGQAISEKTLESVRIQIANVTKKLEILRAVARFMDMQAVSPGNVNCYVWRIQRPVTQDDDTAVLMIKTDTFEPFEVCINTKNDIKVQKIAYKVHNLTAQRRLLLVKALKKCTGLDAHIKRAQAIHRARNFEIRKV